MLAKLWGLREQAAIARDDKTRTRVVACIGGLLVHVEHNGTLPQKVGPENGSLGLHFFDAISGAPRA